LDHFARVVRARCRASLEPEGRPALPGAACRLRPNTGAVYLKRTMPADFSPISAKKA
jgi:hypothetical protein